MASLIMVACVAWNQFQEFIEISYLLSIFVSFQASGFNVFSISSLNAFDEAAIALDEFSTEVANERFFIKKSFVYSLFGCFARFAVQPLPSSDIPRLRAFYTHAFHIHSIL